MPELRRTDRSGGHVKPLRCLFGWHRWQEEPGPLVRDGYRQHWRVCAQSGRFSGCGAWQDRWVPVRGEDPAALTRATQRRLMAGLDGVKALLGPDGPKPDNLV